MILNYLTMWGGGGGGNSSIVWRSRPFTFLYLGAGEGKGLATLASTTCVTPKINSCAAPQIKEGKGLATPD